MKNSVKIIETIFAESKALKQIKENRLFVKILLNKLVITPREIKKILGLTKNFGICCDNDRLVIIILKEPFQKKFKEKEYFKPRPASSNFEILGWWKKTHGRTKKNR